VVAASTVTLSVVAPIASQHSPVYAAVFAAAFLLAGLATIYTMRIAAHQAFAADTGGIRLGVMDRDAKRAERMCQYIPWAEIQKVSIAPAHAGSTVDIVLAPSAPAPRTRQVPVAVLIAMTLLPLSYRLLTPQLLCPRTDPLRYTAPLYRAAPTEVAAALRTLAPASMPVAEMTSAQTL
jgi:hypothetical protein